jgi:murein L,D-transpeptidase YcbB/YkuD
MRNMLLVMACALAAGTCSRASVSTGAVDEQLQALVAGFDGVSPRVHGESLLQSRAVVAFYRARGSRRVWSTPAASQEIIESIRGIERDGLTPADYHLDSLESLTRQRESTPTPSLEADMDLLLTDAVASMLDHVRYGRVLPVTLDPGWNVNPREGTPPLEKELEKIASAPSPSQAIEAAKPQHFIYKGLVGALARLREIQAQGGWPTVPSGTAIAPGISDPRLPVIRARLAKSGELSSSATGDSLSYDDELRKAVELFQSRHRIDPDGTIDGATIEAMNVSVPVRIEQARANIERSRWAIGGLADDFVLVNLPAYKVYLIRGGKNVWETRSQIGRDVRMTPTFRADMRTVVFNPDWTVPPTILAQDVLKGMRKGDNFARKGLEILDKNNHKVDPASIDWAKATPRNFPYTLRQPPGEDNALGQVKFLFPNPFSIYLHDTPHRDEFASDQRTFSSGCIRIQHPLELAEILLSGQDGWTHEKIQQVVATDDMQNVTLEHPLPVLIVYWTVSVGASGEIRCMRDVYGLDPPLIAALNAPLLHR